MSLKDSNGNVLAECDSVTLIKDLKVRGSLQMLKRGILVKNSWLADSHSKVEVRVGGK